VRHCGADADRMPERFWITYGVEIPEDLE